MSTLTSANHIPFWWSKSTSCPATWTFAPATSASGRFAPNTVASGNRSVVILNLETKLLYTGSKPIRVTHSWSTAFGETWNTTPSFSSAPDDHHVRSLNTRRLRPTRLLATPCAVLCSCHSNSGTAYSTFGGSGRAEFFTMRAAGGGTPGSVDLRVIGLARYCTLTSESFGIVLPAVRATSPVS